MKDRRRGEKCSRFCTSEGPGFFLSLSVQDRGSSSRIDAGPRGLLSSMKTRVKLKCSSNDLNDGDPEREFSSWL